MKIILITLIISYFSFAQTDSTYIKTLVKDYDFFTERLNNNLKEQEQLRGILYYIEEKWKLEKQRLDTLIISNELK